MRNVVMLLEGGVRVFFTLAAIAGTAYWTGTLPEDAPRWLYPALLMLLGGLILQLVKHITNLQAIHDNTTLATDDSLLLETLIERLDDDAREALIKDLSDTLSPEEKEVVAKQVEQKILMLSAIMLG